MKKPEVSIIVPTYNEEHFIGECINSILNQSFKNFELIIIDDCSTDKTSEVIKSFKDRRIRYIKSKRNSGAYVNRNLGIKLSKGKYIFFTDADCIADKNWLKEGYSTFKESPWALGVQGITYYVSKNYKPTYSDKVVQCLASGGNYITANIAYKKSVLLQVGLFDGRIRSGGDAVLGKKIANLGEINFSNRMIIIHSRDIWSIKSKILSAKRAGDRIHLIKKYGFREGCFLNILYPQNLVIFLFPPLIILTFLIKRFKTFQDFKLFLLLYPYLILERYYIWKNSVRARAFII